MRETTIHGYIRINVLNQTELQPIHALVDQAGEQESELDQADIEAFLKTSPFYFDSDDRMKALGAA